MGLDIIFILLFALSGYIIGRLGDNYLNFWLKDPAWAPHHWIYGIILVAIGFFFPAYSWSFWIIAFGAGVFVSDLKDFSELKFIGKDNKEKSKRKFWHLD